MKSSKLDNMFNYKPLLEDSKTLSPLTYYQPFQSSFDPDFSVLPPKSTPQVDPCLGGRWKGQGIERPLNASGWRIGGLPDSLPVASTSGWGEPEGRSLCNSTWRSPVAPRPSCSSYEEPSSSKYLTAGGSGASRFSTKSEVEFGGGDGSLLRIGGSFGQPSGQAASVDESLSHSSYYPLVLGSLGKNVGQTSYRTGHNRPMMCNFCKNNKEVPDIYLNHYLYDPETKVLSCPVLRKHVCEICGGTGDQAHTLQYCPVNRERGLQSKVPVLLKTRTITNSTGKIRRN